MHPLFGIQCMQSNYFSRCSLLGMGTGTGTGDNILTATRSCGQWGRAKQPELPNSLLSNKRCSKRALGYNTWVVHGGRDCEAAREGPPNGC